MSQQHSSSPGAVAYYRVSTEKQDSVPTQRAWAQRIIQRDALTLTGEFDDEGISGNEFDRPGLNDLVDFVEKRFFARDPIQSLLVLNLDRLTRRNSLSTGALLDSLHKHGVRYIITTSQRFDLRSPMDRTLISLGSDFTREPELRSRSEHVLNGMAERARAGKWMGGPIPFGYRMGDDGHLILGPEEEVELVRWIFRTYASGRLTANGIARELNTRTPTRWSKSKHWSRNTVMKILKSRNYIGCIVWGEQSVGKFNKLQNGLVVPREDKEDREESKLLKQLKHLPVSTAAETDCIVRPEAHPALIDRETFDACQAMKERNRTNRSASRDKQPGFKGNVWPLAGQMKCGHCGEPVWTMPMGSEGGKRHGTYVERCRVRCSKKTHVGAVACPHSGSAHYVEILDRVISLLQKQLGNPAAIEEMERELKRQILEQAQGGKKDRKRLQARQTELDRTIADAVANLAHTPADLREDVAEYVRKVKADREAVGQQLRDVDAQQRDSQLIDPAEFRATMEMVGNLRAAMDTREDAEQLRAALRDLLAEVRLYFRPRTSADEMPQGRSMTKKVLAKIEVDLTPCFADLLHTENHNSIILQTR